jgi:hypothetical protein
LEGGCKGNTTVSTTSAWICCCPCRQGWGQLDPVKVIVTLALFTNIHLSLLKIHEVPSGKLPKASAPLVTVIVCGLRTCISLKEYVPLGKLVVKAMLPSVLKQVVELPVCKVGATGSVSVFYTIISYLYIHLAVIENPENVRQNYC